MFPESLGKEFDIFVLGLDKPVPDLTDKAIILPELQARIEAAIEDRVGDKPFAIAFSGGVDSVTLAFLSSKLGKKFHLCTVGVKGSADILQAKKVAEHFSWPITVKELSDDDLEKIFQTIAPIIPSPDVVKLDVGAVVYAVLSVAKEEGYDLIMTGLGSEEIFAGYERHDHALQASPQSLHEECWNGLSKLYARDLSRDEAIAELLKMKACAPLLDTEVIKYAMRIDPSLKIVNEQKKMIFREMAMHAGLPEEFAQRKKQAAQYGSSVDKALERIAKKNGCKFKKEYLDQLLKR